MKKSIVQIDQSGRVVIPKPLRQRFQLKGGDKLAIEVRGDVIELRPIQAAGKLERINGVLVFTGAGPFGDADIVERSREERIENIVSGCESHSEGL